MSRIPVLILTVAIVAGSAGCTRTPESAAGFRLPDGDPLQGRNEFVSLQCHQCHTIEGESFPELPV